MKIKKIVRAQEWWSFILPPILLFYYVGLQQSNIDTQIVYSELLLLMFISVITAIIGYFINDLFDIKDDLKAGKKNYVASFPILIKIVFLPALFFVLFLLFKFNAHYKWTVKTTQFLYAIFINILLFLAYSTPPIRLKRFKYAAPFIDALYSGTIFYILAFSISNLILNKLAIIFIFIWALLKGLRNYLSHLCNDKENDETSLLPTMATKYGKHTTQKIANLMFPFEIVFLVVFQFSLTYKSFPFILFCLLFGLFGFKKIIQNTTIQLPLLNDLHEVYLPVLMLVQLIYIHTILFPLLILHFMFFPFQLSKIYFTLKNCIFKLFNKEPLSWKELINGTK